MTATPNSLPAFPRLVLRIGFAGSQKLPTESADLLAKLEMIFETVARRLAEIAPGPPLEAGTPEPRIRDFYSRENPLLRLITGLCEGGDSLAVEAFDALQVHQELQPHVATELAAVIPFDLPAYRASRPPGFLPEFDRLAGRCAYVLALDGVYEKPQPDTALAKNRRARAYRAQSTLLLRHADILVAAADPDGEGRAGGTLETVRAALEFELPVVFLHTGTGMISLIEPGDDPASAIAALAAGEDDWAGTLRSWVTTIVAGSDVEGLPEQTGVAPAGHETMASHGEKLLTEFFQATGTPPKTSDEAGKLKRQPSVGERLWTKFEKSFRSGDGLERDEPLEPYAAWRSRSTELNYHYAGLYRGAFLLNFGLAASAVFLAALSLVLLSYADPVAGGNHTATGETLHHVAAAAPECASPGLLFFTLLTLGAVKLWIVLWIFINTHSANHGDWNDKAVDYRYLAERLRTMFYLPRIGSFQPPMAAPPQYASRVVRQSAVDWLLDAIVRGISPAALATARPETFTFPEGGYEATLVRLEPLVLLEKVRDGWIKQQAIYHDQIARQMDRIHSWAENWGKVLNITVICFVLVDVAFIIAELSGRLPLEWCHRLHFVTPWLVFLAAVLPAAVASLNGIRFQSECRRLAERSAVMRAILSGRLPRTTSSHPLTLVQRVVNRIWRRPIAFIQTLFPFATKPKSADAPQTAGSKFAAADRLLARIKTAMADPATDPASWTPEVLRLAESVADVFVQEVAEWSVLYAKEIPEP